MQEAETLPEKAIDDRKDVYKFWLGLVEKVFLLLLASVIIPLLAGELKIPGVLLVVLGVIGVIVVGAMFILSRKIWNLHKDMREGHHAS